MAMTTASWNSNGFDLATVVMNLQKAKDEVGSFNCSQSSRSTGSGSATPTSLESLPSMDPSDYNTPIECSPLRANTVPFAPMAFAMAPAMPMVHAATSPSTTAMRADVHMGGVMPAMWPAWSHQQQSYQLAAVHSIMAMPAQVAQVDARAGAEAAAGGDEAGAGSPGFRLVWCHERCHKQDTVPKRQMLSQGASECGASLVCLKKADKFGIWISHSQRPPFVLLTDWREAKPCLQALEENGASGLPYFTIVMAEEARQYERAAAWASGLPTSAGEVIVVESMDGVMQVLRERMSSAKSNSAPAAARVPQPASVQLPTMHAPSMLSTGSSVMQYQACAEPCSEILSPLRRGCSNSELAALLLNAMPEHYDD